MANLSYGIPTYKRPDSYLEDPYDSWDEPVAVYQGLDQPNYEVEIHLPGTAYENCREAIMEESKKMQERQDYINKEAERIIERMDHLNMKEHLNLHRTPAEMEYTPDHILRSGDTTIVFWLDGTKTIVKRGALDMPDDYHAFCAALAIKIFGSNSHLKKMLKDKTYIQRKVHGKNKVVKKADLYAPLEDES